MADAGDSESEDEVEYSGMIQPPLIHQLRNILEEYPDDGQILKELIQNAEDAGATEMKILFDDRPLLTTTTINEKKTPFRKYFKGPSLIVHNNALFTEEDWKGIKMLYSSIKEFDPMKVGRFGLGFKSIFHITDHPIIVSGSQLLILDPHKDSSRVCQTMKLQKLNKYRKMKEEDCKAAFDGIFGFDSETLSKGFYQGTLLRFPLRQDATDLSSNIYDREKVMDLFHSFKDEASVTLLFLKSLEKIALYLNKALTGEGKIEPSFHFMVSITEKSLPDVRSCRREFMDKIKALKGRLPSTTLESKIKMEIHTEDDEGKSSDNSWLVVNSMKGGKVSPELKTLSADESLSYSPYVGVALPLVKDKSFQGHVFCFLPLPLEQKSLTGLPVHVNGFFALSQNRRHVKWPSADQIRHRTHKDKSIRWNTCMVQEALSSAYDSLVDHMISYSRNAGNPDHLVRLVLQSIPSPEAVSGHWEILLEPLYACLKKRTFLYTENRGGQWIMTADAIFVNSLSEGLPNPDVRDTVLQVLRQYKVNIVDVPNNVWEMVQSWSVNKITPAYVSRLLKSNSWYTKCETAEKDNLLRYLLLNKDFSLLQDLELLPLADGSYTSFKPRQAKCPVIYLCNEHERQMFPGLEERMVRQLPDNLRPYFAEMVQKNWFRICQPSRSDIISLLEEVIERNFETHATHRVWKKNNPVTKEWLKEVWEYLRNNLLKSLDEVEHLHIIPVETDGSIHLFSLTDLLINKTGKRSALPDEVCRCLKAMSVVVITKLPQFITAHAQLPNYVCDADCEGVIEVLTKLGKNGNLSSSIDRFNSKCSKDEKDALVAMLSSSSSITSEARQILRQMQMFRGNDCDEMVSVLQRDEMITEDFVVKFCRPVMLCLETYQETLAEMLEVRGLSKEDIITDVLRCMNERGFYSKKEQQKIIKYIMENITVFEKNRGIVELLKQVKFVPDGNGVLKKPNELFDYRNKELCELLENPDDFPHQGKVPEKGLDILIKLGLKSEKNLTRHEIIKVANELEHKSSLNTVSEKDRRRATLLLTILSRNANLLENSTNGRCLCDELNNFHIIVPTEPSETYACVMPWFQPQTQLLCPKDMTAHKFISLIGSVQPVLPSDIPHTLVQGFRWDARPKADSVIKQLDILVENYNENYRPQFSKYAIDIYQYLSSRGSQYIYSQLQNKKCIWMGRGFCKPGEIYIRESNEDISLRPYMYPLLPELRQNRMLESFATKLGSADMQTTATLLVVQNKIKQKHEDRTHNASEIRRDLDLTINILNRLKKEKNIPEDILFPVHSNIESRLVFKRVSECNFCNAEWLKADAVEEGDELFFVHPEIPLETAERLGVPSLTDNLLEDTVGLKPWGQTEPLTRRIKNLIKEYKDGFSIPKEMVQNADDAGATRVCLLYDERENRDCQSRLIDDNMKECQGPAIWAYNNAEFSSDDLENITKLSGATKGLDTTKIGKFGLGFCSVYNLTDVPSFLTGHHMVIFDPHTKYLGKSIRKSNPGLKIDLSSAKNRTLIRRMKDQFQPFEGVLGCDLTAFEHDGHYEGTLFRFPLRTEQQARDSEISSVVYNRKEVDDFIKLFIENAGNLLLFTQNVLSIEFYHIPKGMTDPRQARLIHRVSRSIEMNTLSDRPAYDVQNKANPHKVTVLKDVTKEMKDPARKSQEKLSMGNKAYSINIKTEVQDSAQEFCKSLGKSSESKWTVVWSVGTSKSLQLARQSGDQCVLPLASVALLTETTDGHRYARTLNSAPYGFYKESHVFCYLPLPIVTPFQVHINGSFAVTPDRRQLCYQTDDDKATFESRWNSVLMEDAVTNAFTLLLASFPNLQLCNENYYCDLWPVQKDGKEFHGNMQKLYSAFYKHIICNEPKVFAHVAGWVAISSCMFVEPSLMSSNVGKIVFDAAVHFVETENRKVMEMPSSVLKCFTDLGYKSQIQQLMLTKEKFLSQIFFPNINDSYWKDDERDAMVLFALDNRYQKSIDDLLKCTKCIPTYPHGELVKPGDLIHPFGPLAKMFSQEDGKFVKSPKDEKFLTDSRINGLRNLGMMYDRFSEKNEHLLYEQANSVPVLAEKCTTCALSRSSVILEYLFKPYNIHTTIKISVLESLQDCIFIFLPVLDKPANWIFTWKADELESIKTVHNCAEHKNNTKSLKLACPKMLFDPSHKNIVACTELMLDLSALELRPGYYNDKFEILGVRGFKKNTIPLETAVKQLCHLCDNVDLSELNRQSQTCLNQTCQDIYAFIDAICEECKTDVMKSSRISDTLQILKNKPCLLISDKFVKPEHVAIHCGTDCSPILYSLYSNSLRHHGHLLSHIGVKKTFQTEDIMKILLNLSSENNGEKLVGKDLKLYCNLIHLLAELITDTGGHIEGKHLRIPDTDCHLTPIQDLCVDDVEYVIKSKSMKFVHENISKRDAKSIGVKSANRGKLLDHARHFRPFGQKEALTTRIKRILSGYPCDEGILKELLQNADDSKATEIKFILDASNHQGDQKIFDSCWKPLQGPALLVFNNSCFSEEDIEGIQQLGIGSKGDDPTKTGQYGVGFNAVYHLTDVPSFLTKSDAENETLCVMDPMCKYVPDATKENPGMQYEDLPDLRNSFPDVFSRYFEDQLMESKGTIFRLPLRTEIFTNQSDFSKKAVDENVVKQLLKKFESEMFEMLVFVKNVKKITLSRVDSGKVIDDYSVELLISEEDEERRQAFVKTVKDIAEKTGIKRDLRQIPVEEVSYRVEIKDNRGKSQKLLVVQRIGFRDEAVPEVLLEAYREGQIGLLPYGGVAMPLETKHVHDKCKAYCFLPLPIETGIPMHVNGHFALDHEARRNLWTEDKGGYRSEWNRLVLRSVISPAYISALQRLKDILELNSSEEIVENGVREKLKMFDKYFPCHKESRDANWKYLVESIFSDIMRREERLFMSYRSVADGKCIVSFFPLEEEHAEFHSVFNTIQRQLPKQTYTQANSSQKDIKLMNVSKALGMKLLDTSVSVLESMKDAGIEAKAISPGYFIRFLKSFSSSDDCHCNLEGINDKLDRTPFGDLENVKIAFEYCKMSKIFPEEVDGLPLCVTNDSKLKCFSMDSPVFMTKYCKFFPSSPGEFLHENLVEMFTGITTGCFKTFNVKALAEVLPFELQTERYKLGNAPVQWNPKDKGIPNKSWLKSIWEFLKEDTSSIKEHDPTKKARLMASHLFELQRWCLIPCITSKPKFLGIFCNEEQWLFQVSRAKEVLYIPEFDYNMQEALKTLKLPIVADDILPVSCPLLSLVARRDRPEDVLEFLYLHRQEISENTNLTNDVCNTVLEWLNSNLEVVMKNTENNQQCISYLRALPMYLTTFGSKTDLAENMRVLVLPSGMPPNGMKEWARQTRTMLLQQNSRLENIYKVLKVQESNVNDVYMNHIFPRYVSLPKDSRLVHLKFVRDTLLWKSVHCESKLKLIEALKRLHFVEISDGMMALASNFYSPVDEVFQAFLKDTSFSPEPFRSYEWHEFMKMAGLKTELTAELFLKFAKQLENEGRQGCTDALREKSKLLVERMFQGGSHKYDSVLGKIATIKFIAPYQVEKWLTNIHRQYNAEQMICFKGSVPCSFKGIAYTSCDLLPNWANPNLHRPTFVSTGNLQIEKCPSLNEVILHVQNICDSFSKLHETAIEKVGLVKVAEFMENIYDYLQNNAVQNQVLKRLNSTPVLLIKEHKRFVSCTKAVIGLKEEIKPFLFKAPEDFGKYFSVFEKLGTTRETTCDTYAKVVELLHNDIVEKHHSEEEMEMHPNELLVLQKALNAFFKNLPETTEEIKEAMSVPVLYLPSRQKRLVDATKLVYSDRIAYEEKIKHLEEIEYCLDLTEMEISDSWIKLRKLPDQYKPQFLSERLKESLDSENLEPVNSEEFENLQIFVQSREFKDGVIRLITHERRNDRYSSTLTKEGEKLIETGMQGIEIRQVKELKVTISFNGKVVGDRSKDCHYVKTNKTGDRKECIFYCTLNRKETIKWLLSLDSIFRKMIEWCTGHYFKSDLFNKIFLSADNPHQIEDILDENEVQPYEFKDRKRDNIFPTIGTPVHRKWHALLDNLDPEFDEDEYAALLISDVDDEKVFIYVIIEKRLDDSTSENDQINVYTRQYRIKVDRTKTEVRKAYDLYKFTREPQVASMELVVMDSSSQTEYSASADYRPQNTGASQTTADFDQRPLKDIFKELREFVKSAWRLPEDEKKKVLKRLLRKWHPDKNHGNEQKATEVFKYLQNIIKKMENGDNIDEDESNRQTPNWKPDTRTWYDDFFDDINRGCRRDRQSYEEYWYHPPGGSSRGRQNKRHKSYTRYEPYEPNPQPGLARQWFRQARSDLAFAEEALVAASKVAGFNWICFCCYQATENALIALQYHTDAKKVSKDGSIYHISCVNGNSKLQSLARSLESLTGGSKEMRHPNLHHVPKTPSDLYSQAMAEEAVGKTKEVIDIIRDLLY